MHEICNNIIVISPKKGSENMNWLFFHCLVTVFFDFWVWSIGPQYMYSTYIHTCTGEDYSYCYLLCICSCVPLKMEKHLTPWLTWCWWPIFHSSTIRHWCRRGHKRRVPALCVRNLKGFLAISWSTDHLHYELFEGRLPVSADSEIAELFHWNIWGFRGTSEVCVCANSAVFGLTGIWMGPRI